MGMETISGDIIKITPGAFLFAINGDPDDTIWIPKSVVTEGDIDDEDDAVDLLVETWWYRKNEKRFE